GGHDGFGELVGCGEIAGHCDDEPGGGGDVLDRRRDSFGFVAGDQAQRHDPIGIEERRLEHGVLQTRGRETCALEGLETEIGDEVFAPRVDRGARPFLDEESLLTVEKESVDRLLWRHVLDRSYYNGTVIVPSWSMRKTFGGKPVARRPAVREAMSCVVVRIAARSRSGESLLLPALGSRR